MVRNKDVLIKTDRPRKDANPPKKKPLQWLDSLSARAQLGDERDVYNAQAQPWAARRARHSEETEEMFYDELKSLWRVLRVLGMFPLQKPAIGKATFRWFSKEMLYAFCFYVLMDVVVWFEIREKVMLAIRSQHKFDSLMFAILMLLYTIPHLWMGVRHWMGAAALADLMNDWVTFQAEFHHLTRHPLCLNLRRRCTTVVLSTVVFCYLFAVAEYHLLDDDHLKIWEIFYYGYAVILLSLHVFLWCMLCLISARTSKKMMFYFLQDFSWTGGCSSELVHRYRLLWLHLSKLTREIGNVFGYQFGHIILFWFTSLLLSVYYLSTISRSPTVLHVGVGVNGVTIFVSIMVFCLVAHDATDKVGEVVKEKLQKITSEDENTRHELRLFENTIFQNPPVITLGGYVHVNRQLAVSMFSTTVTYLVVILQFDMSDQSGANAKANGTDLSNS